NDYTSWFAADRDMNGDYFGYDGPCPPWNDEIPHRYVFTLYAVDVPQLDVQGTFNGNDVLKALQGHVLAQASLTGVYALNPDLAPRHLGDASPCAPGTPPGASGRRAAAPGRRGQWAARRRRSRARPDDTKAAAMARFNHSTDVGRRSSPRA